MTNAKKINLHLISDSTGETLEAMSRAVMSQFRNVEVNTYVWSLVRTKDKLLSVLQEIKTNKGIVLYTILNEELLALLINEAKQEKIHIVPALGTVIKEFSKILGRKMVNKTGRQYVLNEDYFNRIEAINFTIDHDDGRKTEDLQEADIILVGPSRTSKSPTSIYLSHKGYKTANIPFIYGVEMPQILLDFKKNIPLIVGLSINGDVLLNIRKNRVKQLDKNFSDTNEYINLEKIEKEVMEAKRLYLRQKWISIDVSRKSIEETVATIIQKHSEIKNASSPI